MGFKNRRRAFTLIELLIVVSIIAIVARLILANFSSANNSAQDVRVLDERDQVRAAFQLYYLSNGGYPNPASTSTCITNTSCMLSGKTVNTQVSLSSTTLATIKTPTIKDNQGNSDTGFVYLSCGTGWSGSSAGSCQPGTGFLVFPTYGQGMVCQTVGVWETPFPYGTQGCLLNSSGVLPGGPGGKNGNGGTGGGGTGNPVGGGSFSCSASPATISDSGSNQSVTWTTTSTYPSTDTYKWTDYSPTSQTSCNAGCSSGTAKTFVQTLSSTDIHYGATHGGSIPMNTSVYNGTTFLASNSCNLSVSSAQLGLACTAPSPTTVTAGGSVTWTASVTGGNGSYSFAWHGTDGQGGLSGPGTTVGLNNSISHTYSVAGTYTASTSVVSGSQTQNANCSSGVAITNPAPSGPHYVQSNMAMGTNYTFMINHHSAIANQVSFTQPVTAGDTIIVLGVGTNDTQDGTGPDGNGCSDSDGGIGGEDGNPSVPTDSLGNTYGTIALPSDHSTTGCKNETYVYAATNVIGGTDTITQCNNGCSSPSGGNNFFETYAYQPLTTIIAEYSGLSKTPNPPALGVSTYAQADTPTQNGCLCIVVTTSSKMTSLSVTASTTSLLTLTAADDGNNGGTVTGGSGFTIRQDQPYSFLSNGGPTAGDGPGPNGQSEPSAYLADVTATTTAGLSGSIIIHPPGTVDYEMTILDWK